MNTEEKPVTESAPPEIKELDRSELAEWIAARGLSKFRNQQILRWLYARRVRSFDQMTDIAKSTRQLLDAAFTITPPMISRVETSRDGSRKYLFVFKDGNTVESVLIPERGHYTLCISTQVGCAMGCRFCLTGKNGLTRNLGKAEILDQVLGVLDDLPQERMPLTNIVLMGMGEPLANYENVRQAIDILTDNQVGLQLSHRRITLSTAGIVPRLYDLARDTNIRLAVSLNAGDNETRSMLMPINRKYPLEELIAACAAYPLSSRDKITFEYILIKDVNDRAEDARRLARLLRPVRCKINLIPFNEHPECQFRRPETAAIEAFQQELLQRNYTASIRWSKGADISAACGQLRAEPRE
ncbi:MAG TPA: 23S rRNA (adenine(2503)-C(2))-methyltransferase RlmN [Desulfosalsimonadaceae bacterium]|nr:23S rRNA (adenine(2503)-C(2))-methyltransferase RlmN [Desulfosalsimonadaceae bacterium]